MTRRKIEYWEIPPDQNAEFVACMEDVLETYQKAYVPLQPVLCMDEQPVQPLLVKLEAIVLEEQPVLCMDEQPVQLLKVWWTPKGGRLGPGNERVILTHLGAK